MKEANLEELRDKLIQRVANYSAHSDLVTQLVFDAWSSDSILSIEEISGITVVYTGKEETADTYIERYLYSLPRLAHVVLVTSDGAIQDMALLTGAERISSRQFIKQLEEREVQYKKINQKNQPRSFNTLGDHLSSDHLEQFNKWRMGEDD